MKDEAAQKVRTLRQKITQDAQKEGDMQLEASAKEAKREIEALKELIGPKKAEAVDAIISALV